MLSAERLGRYVVIDKLAAGGMAELLVAKVDGIEGFERHVVLKRIRAEYREDPLFVKMLVDEACVAATLHHQHIVQVNDVGEANGEYFIAMEYLHGADLRAILSAAVDAHVHIPFDAIVAIISAVASGLHYAHEHTANGKRLDIVHRDVTPSNIHLGYDGSVKLVDFGIATAALRSQGTYVGRLGGKVRYMSPEQCRQATIDRRSDIFSLGVVLYELATATRLFKGDSDFAVMEKIVGGEVPSPRKIRPEIPDALVDVIRRALAVDVAERYQTADELRLALDRVAEAAGWKPSGRAVADLVHALIGERSVPWVAPREPAASLALPGPTPSPPARAARGTAPPPDAPAEVPPVAWFARNERPVRKRPERIVVIGLSLIAVGAVVLVTRGGSERATDAPAIELAASSSGPAAVVATETAPPVTADAPAPVPTPDPPQASSPAPRVELPARPPHRSPHPAVARGDGNDVVVIDEAPAPAPAAPPPAPAIVRPVDPPAPPPTPAPPPLPPVASAPPRDAIVAPHVLKELLVSGATDVHPAPATQAMMVRDGRDRVTGAIKVCIGVDGAVTAVTVIKTTGYPDYDQRLIAAVREWRYRPYVAGGAATPACSSVAFQYQIE